RPAHRGPDPARPRQPDARPHQRGDRPAHQHCAQRRPDPGAGQGPDRRPRHPRRAYGEQPDLRRDLPLAACRRRPGRQNNLGDTHMMMGGPGRLLDTETRKPTAVGATLARFWGYFRPYWYAVAFTALLIVTATVIQI